MFISKGRAVARPCRHRLQSRHAAPPADYRPAVTAFYVALAAMQTGQDVHARRELERVTQLAPDEAAASANLGLLTLRQQQDDEAARHLAKASQLAPNSAAIERLLALSDSRKGNLDGSVRHWRRAIELDVADLDAPYALAQELERLGGAANDADAQRVLDTLGGRSGNLAAQLEYARVAARRGDAAALGKVVAFLVAAVEAAFRLMERVHAPYYALFLVGPVTNLVEIVADRRRRTALLTPG